MEGTVVTLSDVTCSQFHEEPAWQEGKQEALKRLADGIVRQFGEPVHLAEESVQLWETLPPDSPMRREVEAIERAGSDAFAMRDRLHAFLQPPKIHPERVDVRRVLERLETAWKLIEPRLKIAEDLESGFVQADSWQLTRALVSIILHARSRKNYGGFLTLYSLGDSALAVELSGAEMNKGFIRFAFASPMRRRKTQLRSIRYLSRRGQVQPKTLHVAFKLVKGMGGLMGKRRRRGSRRPNRPNSGGRKRGSPAPAAHPFRAERVHVVGRGGFGRSLASGRAVSRRNPAGNR